MKDLLKDMTPIEYVGAAMIVSLFALFAVTFTTFLWAVITGDADLANSSYGIADLSI